MKLTMYLMVKSRFEADGGKMVELPGFTLNRAKFEETVDAINKATARMNFTGEGVNQEKEEAKALLAKSASQVSAKVLSYARFNRKAGLASEVNYTGYMISRLSMQNMLSVCETIHLRAAENLTEMGDFLLTKEEVDGLRSAIDAYRVVSIAPIQKRQQKRLSQRDTELLFDLVDQQLEDIDVVVSLLQFDEPLVYENYKLARRLVPYPTTTLSVKGNVKDAATALPISSAVLEFVELDGVGGEPTGEDPVLTKSTADKGGFMVRSIPEGVYRVKVTKLGYKEKSVDLIVNAREMSDLVMTLESA